MITQLGFLSFKGKRERDWKVCVLGGEVGVGVYGRTEGCTVHTRKREKERGGGTRLSYTVCQGLTEPVQGG